MPPSTLETFLGRIEEGYCRYRNPYHNNLHAADVAQTVHYMLCQTGLMVIFKFLSIANSFSYFNHLIFQNWLTDLEIFATLVAAIIHDYEHTGTTNNFHVMSGSDTALLYNDRAVLENHHISASFRSIIVLQQTEFDSPKFPTQYILVTEWLKKTTATYCGICHETSSASFARSLSIWCWPLTCRFIFNKSKICETCFP